MPLLETRGAASVQGFGALAASARNYIEDVFSTYLYDGNGSTQTITNGIDLAGKGGLVWLKGRSGATDHALYDTARGATKDLVSNSTAAETTQSTGLTAFSSTGFSIGALAKLNTNTATYVSWTFRKQAKFFDVVTYTGDGANRTISHNLGSVPGCIIVKRTDTTADWQVYHRSIANTEYLVLNTTAAKATGATRWNSTTPTSTVFSLGTDTTVNANTGTYVAYLFAHDAGGFGASGSDNVISCGSFTSTVAALNVTLGWEPQFLCYKRTNGIDGWHIADLMRGFQVDRNAGTVDLQANSSAAETAYGLTGPTATGFTHTNGTAGDTYIYIAIRRGPMKTPTTGTSVFKPQVVTDSTTGNAINTINSGFVVDSILMRNTTYVDVLSTRWANRLTSGSSQSAPQQGRYLSTPSTNAEANCYAVFDANLSAGLQTGVGLYSSVLYGFQRAPGFFDVVCYTGTGAPQTVNHNLGIAPELIIGKQRNGTFSGQVWHKDLGFYSGSNTYGLYLFSTSGSSAKVSSNAFGGSPTSTTFVASTTETAQASSTFVAYLFATVAGVSKVGSYTGTGSTLQIDCGFTGGARFVLIKRADSTGDWYVWDSARGIVAGNDPYLLLNSTAAEVTSTDYVDTYSAGFEISSTAPAAINANGGSFIFLAIA